MTTQTEAQQQAPPGAGGGGGWSAFAATLDAKWSQFKADLRAEFEALFGPETEGTEDAGEPVEAAARPEPEAEDTGGDAAEVTAAELAAAGASGALFGAEYAERIEEQAGQQADAAVAVLEDDRDGTETGDDGDDEPTLAEVSGTGGGDTDYTQEGAAWTETFNNGTGALNHLWSGDVDTSVPGQITLRDHSGVMQFPGGAGEGFGFGKYTATVEVEGNAVGAAALLWPSDNEWPGTEMNFVEVLNDGTAYGTAHRDLGYDWYQSTKYAGLDESQVHTYGIDWQADGVTYSVDGVDVGRVEMDSADAANGGANSVFGMMNMNPGTSLTVYDLSYTPSSPLG